MARRVTVAQLAAKMEEDEKDFRVNRDRVWLNLTTIGVILVGFGFILVTYLGDRNHVERQFGELNISMANLAKAVDALRADNGDQYRRSDAIFDCALAELSNKNYTCPLITIPRR